MSVGGGPQPSSTPEKQRVIAPAARKPRLAIVVATACGLGYLPKAPGTWGSLGGLLVALSPWWGCWGLQRALAHTEWGDGIYLIDIYHHFFVADPYLVAQVVLAVAIGIVGVWSASRTARFWGVKDPQRVVIDEVSGQHLTLLLGCGVPVWWRHTAFAWTSIPLGLISTQNALNWKYLLVGFILFRAFDIWKPFPARQAESLPGGWGIMTDDWVAGIYAAMGLWIARAAGF